MTQGESNFCSKKWPKCTAELFLTKGRTARWEGCTQLNIRQTHLGLLGVNGLSLRANTVLIKSLRSTALYLLDTWPWCQANPDDELAHCVS